MSHGLIAAVVLTACLPVAGPAEAAAPVLQGRTVCPWGSPDCNPCVPDVLASMGRLRSHGDILGFHMNGAADVTVSHHWQGVQRLMSGGGPYLAISRSVPGGEDVSFVIVEMASRNGLGERFRSNRLDPDVANFATPPPPEDRDIQDAAPGTGDTTFLLRAERSVVGEGRIYTIVYRATDGSGNAREVTALVSVPRSR